jgi:hypothetical protein
MSNSIHICIRAVTAKIIVLSVMDKYSCGTVAPYGPFGGFFQDMADHRATEFSYTKFCEIGDLD